MTYVQIFMMIQTSLDRGIAKGFEIHIRDLPPEIKAKLKVRAKSEGRTVNGLARKILEQAVGEDKLYALTQKIYERLLQK